MEDLEFRGGSGSFAQLQRGWDASAHTFCGGSPFTNRLPKSIGSGVIELERFDCCITHRHLCLTSPLHPLLGERASLDRRHTNNLLQPRGHHGSSMD